MADETLEAFGQDVEPSTGNEIPPGSLPEEVKDDIPAMLSEGEYVVPADVLRFYGIKFFEDLRRQAKTELAMMERNGRVGGDPVELDGDEALPFAVAELRTVDVEDDDVAKANKGLYANRSKEDSTISKEAYAKMVAGFTNGGVTDYVSEEEKDLISITPNRPTLVEFVNEAGDISYHRRMPSQDGGFVYVPPVPDTYRLKSEVDEENQDDSVAVESDMEYGGELDPLGMVPGSSGSLENQAKGLTYTLDVLTGARTPSKLDNFFSTSPTTLALKSLDNMFSAEKDMGKRTAARATKALGMMDSNSPAYANLALALQNYNEYGTVDQNPTRAPTSQHPASKTKLSADAMSKYAADISNINNNNNNTSSSSTTSGGSSFIDGNPETDFTPGQEFNDNNSNASSGGFSSSIGNIDPGDKDFMYKGGLAGKKSKKKAYNKGGAVKGYTTTKKPKYSKGGLASKKKKM